MNGLAAFARAVGSAAARLTADARDLVLPPHCPGCGRVRYPDCGEALCMACRRDLPALPQALCPGCGIAAAPDASCFCPSCAGRFSMDAVVFAAPYAGTARELVRRFKYRADLAAGRLLGGLLAERVAEALAGGVDLVVPVPLHRWRLCRRGFNQAAVLARAVARRLGSASDVAALGRRRRTRVLAGLDPGEREREVRDAFAVRRPQRVAGRAVLVVDDVLTTGATAEGCCVALKAAGARWTGVAVAARVLAPLRRSLRPVS